MRMKIHTKGITGSGTTKKGEEPGAMFSGLLEIDGELYDRVTNIEANFEESFATVTVTFVPGHLEVVNHTEETWPKLAGELQAREARLTARNSEGRVIAIYVSPDPEQSKEEDG